MTAPFAPELLSPKNKSANPSASVTLQWRFRSVVAGDSMATFAIRRRAMTPTIGSYEYWSVAGNSWTTETFNAGPGSPNEVKDGMTHSVAITVGWTTDVVYQWSVKCRNGAAEASAYADDSLLTIHAAPTMTVTVSSTGVSRPTLAWVWAGGTGAYQKSYRLAIYTAAVRNAVGFDASLAVWQAQATWITDTKYSATDWKRAVTADLESGTQYYVFYQTTDNSDLASAWTESTNFTPSFTAVPAPSITATPNINTGVIDLIVRTSANLLSDDNSIFEAGIGTWVGSLNCQTIWLNSTGKLKMLAGGMSYAALDTAHTTYTAQDTAYSTYAVQRSTQASPANTARIISGATAGERITVTPATAYSVVATLTNRMSTNRTGKIGFRWYQSGGAASSTPLSQSTGFTLTPNTEVIVKLENVAAPGDAATAAIEIEWTNAAVDDYVEMDNVAMAATASIAWSPSGNNLDLSFVVERSTDQVTWLPVWGCSTTNPRPADSNSGQIALADRSVPLGVSTVYYRAWAISKSATAPTWSTMATQSAAGMDPERWWLRRTSRTDRDVRAIASQFNVEQSLPRDVVEPEGRTAPVVNFGSTPKTQQVNITMTTLDKDQFELTLEALAADETLYMQTNLDGYGYYFRVIDRFTRTQKRAKAPAGNPTNVRNLFEINFSGLVVDYAA